MSRTLPSASFFLPDRVKTRRFEESVLDPAYKAPLVLHFTHGSCLDGATCDVLVRLTHGATGVATVYLEPYDTARALELIQQVPGRARELIVSDLSFQKGQGERVAKALATLADEGWRVSWRDHHAKQWGDGDVEAIMPHANVTIDKQGIECGATLVQKDLLPDDAFAAELAHVVRDHDLWIREDPRATELASACHGLGSQRYVSRLLASKRVDDPALLQAARKVERRKDADLAWALKRAFIAEGNQARVGVIYGNVPTNEVLHGLEERGAHVSILLKPGGGVSLRSRKDVPVCHVVAQAYGGGGHPNASGCKLPIDGTLRYARYWMRRGNDPAVTQLVSRTVNVVDEFLASGGKTMSQG